MTAHFLGCPYSYTICQGVRAVLTNVWKIVQKKSRYPPVNRLISARQPQPFPLGSPGVLPLRRLAPLLTTYTRRPNPCASGGRRVRARGLQQATVGRVP